METRRMQAQKRIALVAHDHRKKALCQWVKANRDLLQAHQLLGTGGTGAMVMKETGLNVNRLLSGPLGGDQQLGGLIAQGEIDVLIFFWDPLEPQPHDPDVKALLRIAVLYNIPTASNRASADFLISSPFFSQPYEITPPDYPSRLRDDGG